MTCVVGWVHNDKKITFGCDSAATGHHSQSIRRTPKVFKRFDMIFAFCGSFRMGDVLEFKLDIPDHPEEMSDREYMCTFFVDALRACFYENGIMEIANGVEGGGAFMVGYRGKIYQIYEDFQVGVDQYNFAAMGSGEDLALGSLYTTRCMKLTVEDRLKKALQAASKFNSTVRPPFNFVTLE